MLAPAVAPLLIFVLFSLLPGYEPLSVLAIPIGAFTYAVALLLGLPVLVALRKLRWLSAWQFALAGAILGLAPLGFFMLIGASYSASFLVEQLLQHLAIGLLSAWTFWLLGVWRNPWL